MSSVSRYRIIAIGILITCNSKDEANNNGIERAKARHHYSEIHLDDALSFSLTLKCSQRLNQLIFSTFSYVRLAIISEQIIYNENLIENCVAWVPPLQHGNQWVISLCLWVLLSPFRKLNFKLKCEGENPAHKTTTICIFHADLSGLKPKRLGSYCSRPSIVKPWNCVEQDWIWDSGRAIYLE